MKFVYEYRSADNVRHTGSITAPDKDAVYAALKAKGIRPSRVTEAPGFLNKLFGKYKRWTAIVLLSALVAWLLVMILSGEGADGGAGRLSPRAQLYGDPVVVRECEDALWTNVFASAFDCRLAQYAIPGRVPNLVEPMASALPETPDAAVAFVEIAEEDLAEIVHMKRMVNGIKQELSDYITAGGTLEKYLKRLDIRQRAERGIYETAQREITSSDDHEFWRFKNAELRAMGLPMVATEDPDKADFE